jgi:hypothetical protein
MNSERKANGAGADQQCETARPNRAARRLHSRPRSATAEWSESAWLVIIAAD